MSRKVSPSPGLTLDISIQLRSAGRQVRLRDTKRQVHDLLLPKHIRAPDPKAKKKRSSTMVSQGSARDHGWKGKTHIAGVVFQPPVRSEGFNIFAEDFSIPMDYPRVDTNYCLGGCQYVADDTRYIHTPSGINRLSISMPPAGVTLGRLMPTAG